jgi:hypothetical protein
MLVPLLEKIKGHTGSDALLERNIRILQLPTATKRNISSLLNWVEGTRSICRKEVRFLHERDLCTAENSSDNGLAVIESLVERVFVRFCEHFQKVSICCN